MCSLHLLMRLTTCSIITPGCRKLFSQFGDFFLLNLHARHNHADVAVHVDAVAQGINGCALRTIFDNEAKMRWTGIVDLALVFVCCESDFERLVVELLELSITQIFDFVLCIS